MKNLKYLNKFLYKYRGRLSFGALCIIASNLFSVFSILIIRYSFNLVEDKLELYKWADSLEISNVIKNDFIHSILIYIILFFSSILISGFFLFLTRQTIIVMSRLIENDMKDEIYAHYQDLPLSFYRKNRTGDLMTRISEDVSKVRMYLGPAIMYGINMVALFSITITFMLNVNVKLTLFSLLPLPLLSIAIYYVSNKMNRQSEVIQTRLSGLSNLAQEAFSGIRVLKSFVRENDFQKIFEEENEHYRTESLKLIKINSLFVPLIFLLIGLSTAFTVYIGGIEVANGTARVGNIAEFVLYINKLTWPVASLGWITSLVQRADASQRRINEFLNQKTDLISTKNLMENIEGSIRFNNVNVIYPDSNSHALKDVSFTVNHGESIGIIGQTGSGKSTISATICRLIDPGSGVILLDGKDLKEYNINYLRDNIGYVPQDVFLFSDTVKNNISFGKTFASEEEIVQAAKDADIYRNIKSFQNGFETLVGERGVTLSGGQKQRISIARAIIKEPKILIFDDCLSAVDTQTEEEILNNLKRIMQGKTSIMISHRISTISWCDKILVLDEGRIIESGSHEELLSKNGVYREIYEKQAR